MTIIDKQDAMSLGASKSGLKRMTPVDYEGACGSARYELARLERMFAGITKRYEERQVEDEAITYTGGRDQFSAMRLPKLESLVSDEVYEEITSEITSPKYQAVAYRFVLRGYSVERALQVVEEQRVEGYRRAVRAGWEP